MEHPVHWKVKAFDALSAAELYDILNLRNLVFVVEQQCIYLDTDGKDKTSLHLAGYAEGRLVAYARLVPPGVSYNEASIGRVVTHPHNRQKQWGRKLMLQAIEHTQAAFGAGNIRISAQQYLQAFYTSLGFKTVSEMYLEDDIPHIEMLYNSTK